MSGGGGQQPVTQQTTQTRDPWSVAQPFLGQELAGAQQLYQGDIGYVPFGGNTTASLNPNLLSGMGGEYGIAIGEPYGSTGVNAARGYLGDLIGNQGLNAGLQQAAGQFSNVYQNALGNENPYLQSVINQQVSRANSAASGMGRYGSGAHDAAIAQAIAPTLAQDYQQRQQLQMQATSALGDLYGQGLQRAGQAAQLVPTLDEARYQGAAHLMDVGQVQRQYDQALLDQQLKLYNAQQARPWEQLFRYAAGIGGAGGLGGSQISTSPGATQPSMLQRGLGGALVGAGLGSAIFPGVGTGIGAVGGGLLGLL
jgi:hypothetical protein